MLLIVVDGCAARVLGPAIAGGRLPTLARLAAAGTLHLRCLSIFPSITPAATSSIITGRYPRDHGVGGMSWVDANTGEVTYFGDDIWTVAKRGLGNFMRDFLLKLNHEHLRATTLFQRVERHGLRAGCINYLIFRGDTEHIVRTPLLLRLWPGVPSEVVVNGPSFLCLGDFVADLPWAESAPIHGGPFARFGLDDAGTAAFLGQLATVDALPDFTVAYFADNDFDSHDHGPDASAKTLERVDARLKRVFDAWGGLDRVLERVCVVLTADHSHTDIDASPEAGIDLDEMLAQFPLSSPGSRWEDKEAVMICPNMRAAQLHLHRPSPHIVARLCGRLLSDRRVDQVIWIDEQSDFHVATADRGHLRFRLGRPSDHGARDVYGAAWEVVDGDLSAVDARVDAGGRLHYGVYPNALERIVAGLVPPPAGQIWITARPGYEFRMPGQRPHLRGGSHGTLHELDSVVPLLIAGAPPDVALPEQPRIVDVAPICSAILGLPAEVPAGASHASGVAAGIVLRE